MNKVIPPSTQANKYSLFGWLVLPLFFCALVINFTLSTLTSTAQSNKTDSKTSEAIFYEVPKDGQQERSLFDTQGRGAATILFNNSWASQFKYGYPYLKKNNLKGSTSVITSYLDYPAYFKWDQIKEVSREGWEIVSQTENFVCEWEALNTDQVREEVYGSKHELLSHGVYSKHFASPCGKVDIRLTDRVTYYYSTQIIGEEGTNFIPVKEKYLLKSRTITNRTSLGEMNSWINGAINNNGWIIFTFNQIEEQGDESSITPEKFQEAINLIVSSQIAIVVPSQIINEER